MFLFVDNREKNDNKFGNVFILKNCAFGEQKYVMRQNINIIGTTKEFFKILKIITPTQRWKNELN